MITAVHAARADDDEGDLLDSTSGWETELNAVAAARIHDFPSSPLMTNGMTSLRVTLDEGDSRWHKIGGRLYHPTFYRLNGWLNKTPPTCPIYRRLMDAFGDSLLIAQRISFLLRAECIERDDPDTKIVRDYRALDS